MAMGTGCECSEEELLAILRGTGNEKPHSPSSEGASADDTAGYVAPKAEDVLEAINMDEEGFCDAVGDDPSETKEFISGFSSKKWKERQESYTKALELLGCASGEEKTRIISELVFHLSKIVDDNNVSSMNSALELCALW